MPKKKLNIVLVAALLVVWGLIMYKLFWDGSSEEVIADDFTAEPTAAQESLAPDTIELALNYRDPFLGKRPKVPKKREHTTIATTNGNNSNKKKPEKVAQPDPTPIKWPAISYTGLIENQVDHKQVAIVTIDNQSQLLGVGDSATSVALVLISNDSILVTWNGLEKTVYLK